MSSSAATSTPSTDPAILVSNLTYTFPNHALGLHDVSLSLPAGSRTLLIGANGAGKTTLLRLLSGKRLSPAHTISIHGVDPFSAGLTGVTYLGLEWVLNSVVRTDIPVSELLRSVGGDAYPSRRDQLVRILDIDAERWRMHAVSDGERRRVQLAMGLLRPWKVLLLDEVTVDLDVLARSRFLRFLKEETQERGAVVVYATHIVDGLGGWPTHVVRMTLGEVRLCGRVEEVLRGERERWERERAERSKEQERKGREGAEGGEVEVDVWGAAGGNSMLLELVLRWLEEDLEERGPRGGQKGKSEAQSYEHLEKNEYLQI